MIPNEKGGHCLAAKKLSALLRQMSSKHNGDCLNCLHCFRISFGIEIKIEIKWNFMKKYVKIKIFVEFFANLKK